MVVHSDQSAFPEEAKKLYAELQGEKELVRRERDPVLPHAPRRTTGHLTLPGADPR